jgi:hypothetical protein
MYKYKNLTVDTSKHDYKDYKVDTDDDLPLLKWNDKDIIKRKKEIESKDDLYFRREMVRKFDEKKEYEERVENFDKKIIESLKDFSNLKSEDEKKKYIQSLLNFYIENLDLLELEQYREKYDRLKNSMRDKLIHFYYEDKWYESKEYFQKIFYEEI